MTDMQEHKQVQDTLQTIEVKTTPVVTDSPQEPPKEDVRVEEFKISGDALVSKIKELIHQGNIRRIILKTEEGNTLIEIPLTVGVVGGVLSAAIFPVIAAIGVIGALVAHLTVVIEKKVSN
ncbi:DUF4342 domain-containing protein [Leptothermofonsia sp. ETS-13]|uniref:DUF4342 domain-containing protein n=1 Tax=Leptothermofonsia sp. ETS-13 TaxID=3035696 RepID=UPI003BA09DDC